MNCWIAFILGYWACFIIGILEPIVLKWINGGRR